MKFRQLPHNYILYLDILMYKKKYIEYKKKYLKGGSGVNSAKAKPPVNNRAIPFQFQSIPDELMKEFGIPAALNTQIKQCPGTEKTYYINPTTLLNGRKSYLEQVYHCIVLRQNKNIVFKVETEEDLISLKLLSGYQLTGTNELYPIRHVDGEFPTFNNIITRLTFADEFNQLLGQSLSNLTNLQTLQFGHYFNQPLGQSLSNLINLQTLQFEGRFNKPLDQSLSNLTKLRTLQFGFWFHQPLDQSLSNLINLQTLQFGYCFNQPLDQSLSNLTNLQTLQFGYRFNQPLDQSLSNLANLQTLQFGYRFHQPLDQSLKKIAIRDLTS